MRLAPRFTMDLCDSVHTWRRCTRDDDDGDDDYDNNILGGTPMTIKPTHTHSLSLSRERARAFRNASANDSWYKYDLHLRRKNRIHVHYYTRTFMTSIHSGHSHSHTHTHCHILVRYYCTARKKTVYTILRLGMRTPHTFTAVTNIINKNNQF